MSDLRSFARETERSVDQPAFEVMVARQRQARRRRAARSVVVAVAAVLALALAIAGLSQLRHREIPAEPAPPLLVPSWRADQIVGNADAFVVKQVDSRTDAGTTLTVWKRCKIHPLPNHVDCLGREAIAVTDLAGHRLITLAAVTDAGQTTSPPQGGLLREVGAGLWYWAHRDPGPYLLSATMSRPAPLTLLPSPAVGFGLPGVECPDGVGLCTLHENAGTVQRLALPRVPDVHWAVPTATGCGLWGLAGTGTRPRLVIQQRDGSFGSVDIPANPYTTTMAEGGPSCEVAYYQSVTPDTDRLVVSVDQGATWQVRQTPLPQVAGYYEHQPRDRFLIPPHWTDLPVVSRPVGTPGVLRPL
jgi:hypothetical protein